MRKGRESHFVVCIQNDSWPASLELKKIYETLPDDDAEKSGWIRVIDESGEDYLYPEDCFAPVSLPGETEKLLRTLG